MKAVIGVLLMLLRVSHGMEPSCDGRKNGAQCYGALGGAVDLQLMDNLMPRFKWFNNSSVIFNWRNNKIVDGTKDSRFIFIPSNGTARISELNMNDSGEYRLEMFNNSGIKTGNRTLSLFVQAPVSSVQLVPECLSQGQMKVSCLSDGDSPQYAWTLNGTTPTDSELFSGNNETNIIILRQNIRGRLVCSVRNEVSSSSKGMTLTSCGFINCTSNGTQIAKWVYERDNTLCVEPTTVPTTVKHTSEGKKTQTDPPTWYSRLLPVIAGVLASLLIVLLMSIVFICAHKKKKNLKRKTTKAEEDDQEMTYADVRIVKKQGRKVEPSAEADVEYGQVKFSKRQKPRPEQSNPTVDDSVYAQVRKGR